MSLPLGTLANQAGAGSNNPIGFFAKTGRTYSVDSVNSKPLSFDSIFSRDRLRPRAKSRPNNHSSYSARAWVHRTREVDRPDNSPLVLEAEDPRRKRQDSAVRDCNRPAPHDSFDLPGSRSRSQTLTRPKHIPIVVDYTQPSFHIPPPLNSAGSFSTLSRPRTATGSSTFEARSESASFPSRIFELKIPDWAKPGSQDTAGSAPHSPKAEPKEDYFSAKVHLAVPTMAQLKSSMDTSQISDPNASRLSPDDSQAFHSEQIPRASLANGLGRQTSLNSFSAADEASASEAEDGRPDDMEGYQDLSANGTSDPRTSSTTPTPAANSASLSGLVCNVHRTTGEEPPPLVGATTTILGDKLYVFGGRTLSRTKPALSSSLYELDLIKRHWTRVETQGDIPSPRYFHSMCALGDTKLVCYGGMSPGGVTAQSEAEVVTPDVTVMSDIHIFDVTSLKWTRLSTPDAPQGRYAHCATILPSSAVFASKNAPLSAIHHNPSGANPNSGTLGVALDGAGGAEMVVVGGQDSANLYIEQVSVFNLRSLKWTGTTGMGRSCGAYRTVVTPLTTMSASQIGAGPSNNSESEEGDEQEDSAVGSGAATLIYSNYNFLSVKLELQIRLTDGTLIDKPMSTALSPPGLRFPNGGIIANHFVVSGTFLTSSRKEYAVWALDLRTLTWSRIDAGSSIFSQGSWNRGVVWNRRNSLVILGNRRRSLVHDYNNRRINFSNVCVVELEVFGFYENPKVTEPTSSFVSAGGLQMSGNASGDFGRMLSSAAKDLGTLSLSTRELADMDFLAIDGTRIPVNSRLIARRWGPYFNTVLRDALTASSEAHASGSRPPLASQSSRASSITITPSVTSSSTSTTLHNATAEVPDTEGAPAPTRPRLFYLPHTPSTLHALLNYLYTSTLPLPPHPLATPQTFCSLLQLARPYRIDGLLEAVIERLHDCIDGRNAAAVFNAAAMGAGGGNSVHYTPVAGTPGAGNPARQASLARSESSLSNGASRTVPGLRIDTNLTNGGGRAAGAADDEEVPSSAHTDGSASESEGTFGTRAGANAQREVWNGSVSAVVGLQKRGLRGLMEGRRLRERGRSGGIAAGHEEGARVGLGIA